MSDLYHKLTKKDLLKEIGKLKKNEILKIVEEYCPNNNKKGGFLFFEESIQNKNKKGGITNQRNNIKRNNKSFREEIVFDQSKLVQNNSGSIMNNNKIYNVIDYE
jgi:hypothetical protein